MHFVKEFDMNGVATKQVACIELHGKPNAATEGYPGVLGIDLDSPLHDVYKCVAVNGSIYTWELLSSGLSIMSATISGGGAESAQFPYANLRTPTMYVVKIGDLILDYEGYLYQIDALNSTYCSATYCGLQVSADGKSAYDVAVKNGFEGTEEEWLASLQGDRGATDVGSGEGSIQTVADNCADGINFNGKNPSAEETDIFEEYTDDEGNIIIPYGASGAFSASFNGKSAAIGKRSLTEGTTTIAVGDYSHAEGNNSVSGGLASHAEGLKAFASGVASHSEGGDTVAVGDASHAEGNGTKANGYASHSEGNVTKAIGNSSHAEGQDTTAFGNYSHAEGVSTMASGEISHAEGASTSASGYASHSEGSENIAGSAASHAEGSGNTIEESADASHAEGSGNTVSGKMAHAEGQGNTVSGESAHAEGAVNTASGKFAHAEGEGTTASGYVSHSEGYYTSAIGSKAHAEGERTNASGIDSHAEGYFTVAFATASHAEGASTSALGEASHAEGRQGQASGEASHTEGSGCVASGIDAHAEGHNTKAASDYQHVQGRHNIEDDKGKYAHIVGNGTPDVPSNAHTLDWNGCAWYKDGVKVGGTSQDDGKALATEEFVTKAIADAIANAPTYGGDVEVV